MTISTALCNMLLYRSYNNNCEQGNEAVTPLADHVHRAVRAHKATEITHVAPHTRLYVRADSTHARATHQREQATRGHMRRYACLCHFF